MFQLVSHLHIWFFDAILPVLAGDRCQSATVISGHPVLSHSFPCFLRTVMSGATLPSWWGSRRNASGNVGPETNQPLFVLPQLPPQKKSPHFWRCLKALNRRLESMERRLQQMNLDNLKAGPGDRENNLGKLPGGNGIDRPGSMPYMQPYQAPPYQAYAPPVGVSQAGQICNLKDQTTVFENFIIRVLNFLAGPGGPPVRCPRSPVKCVGRVVGGGGICVVARVQQLTEAVAVAKSQRPVCCSASRGWCTQWQNYDTGLLFFCLVLYSLLTLWIMITY